jgi:ABC-type uncharacterized transport system substrate-binding protein
MGVALLLCSLTSEALAQASKNLNIVFRNDISIHRQLVENLKKSIKRNNSDTVVSSFPISKNWSKKTQAALLERKSTKLVAIGDVALSFCMNTAPDIPGVFLMLTSKQLVDKAESSGKWKGAKVWVEPQIQFKIIRDLMPDVRTVGVVLTPNCRECRETFIKAASKYGLKLKTIQTEERRQLIPALKKVYQQSDVYLLLPDPSLLNDIILRELLRLQREYQRPLIGPAMPFVRMGAMMSINYKLDTLVQYIAENISNNDLMGDREKISECCLEVSINPQVTEQLDVRLQTDTIKSRVHIITPEVKK